MRSGPPGSRPRPYRASRRDRSSAAAAAAAAAGGTLALAYLGPWSWPVHEAVLGLVAAGTLLAMGLGLRWNAPPRRGPWEVLFLGAVLCGAGGLLRLDRHSLGVLAGRPLGPDIVVVVGGALFAFAFSVLGRAPHPHEHENPDMVLDGLVAGVAAWALLWSALVEPAISSRPAGAPLRALLPTPTALDAYVLAVAVIALAPRARRNVAARWLLVVAAALGAADGLYLVDDVGRAAVPHALVGALYLLAAGALGAAFLHPSMRRLFGGRWRPPSDPARSRDRLVAVVLVPALLALVGLLGPLRPDDQRIVLGAAAAACVLLAAMRVGRAAHAGARTEARLLHDVTHDPLTGLGNRTFAERATAMALAAGASADEEVAVIFLDLDRFKLVNDAHGYSCGDQLLIEVGERLTRAFGRRGELARVGGDEFVVVVFPVAGVAAARREAQTAHDAVSAPFHIYGAELLMSASVGVAVSSAAEPTTDAETMLRDADTAMYQAKGSGRDMVAAFDRSMRDRIADRLALEHDLRLAVERGEFRLMFQPIVTLAEDETVVAGFEALLRWDRPTRGLVPASVFIECAEASGLLTEIGDWVIREACAHLAEWREIPGTEGLFVSVNVSSLHLRSHNLAPRVRRAIAETGLDPYGLCIELAEQTLMENPAEGVALVIRLRELGVRLAVDNFGNSYASLAYLRQFPVDYVKIDRRFVQGLAGEDSTDATLVAAIIAMAEAVGATTVAEGVEHERQEQILRDLGCDLAQGFLYARPVPPDDVVPTLRALSPRHGLRLVTGDGAGGRPGR
jgi:diguanylate cyclase